MFRKALYLPGLVPGSPFLASYQGMPEQVRQESDNYFDF